MNIRLTFHEKDRKQLLRITANPLDTNEINQLTTLADELWKNKVRHEFFPNKDNKFIPATILDVYLDEVHEGLTI